MKIPWEILIAVLLNLLVICIFVNIRNSAPRKASPLTSAISHRRFPEKCRRRNNHCRERAATGEV